MMCASLSLIHSFVQWNFSYLAPRLQRIVTAWIRDAPYQGSKCFHSYDSKTVAAWAVNTNLAASDNTYPLTLGSGGQNSSQCDWLLCSVWPRLKSRHLEPLWGQGLLWAPLGCWQNYFLCGCSTELLSVAHCEQNCFRVLATRPLSSSTENLSHINFLSSFESLWSPGWEHSNLSNDL